MINDVGSTQPFVIYVNVFYCSTPCKNLWFKFPNVICLIYLVH